MRIARARRPVRPKNAYLDELLHHMPQDQDHISINSSKKPLFGRFRRRTMSFPADLRHDYVTRFAWAIPDAEAVRAIVALGPVVEIGAGTGYWASLLSADGCDVVAYDRSPGRNHWCANRLYYSVRSGAAEEAGQHADKALFLCWPPYGDQMAARALAAYQKSGGRFLAYAGEHRGGCCADDLFFWMLDRWWNEDQVVDLPRWEGLHDRLYIFSSRLNR